MPGEHRKLRRRGLLIREKKGFGSQKGIETPLCQRKTEGGLETGLANLWNRKKITKKAHAGRGQEIKWEIPV
jgi:hypothetical protein